MTLEQAVRGYAPRALSDEAQSTEAYIDWPITRLNVFRKSPTHVGNVHQAPRLRPEHFISQLVAPATKRSPQALLQRESSATSSLIEKSLRHRVKRHIELDWQRDERGQQEAVGLQRALYQHIRNQVTAINAQMSGGPDDRAVALTLLQDLEVLLDDPEEALRVPSRLRSAARHEVLEEQMLSEGEIVEAVRYRADSQDIAAWRVQSILLALPINDGYLYPKFQLDQDGNLHEVVQRVNTILNATDHPWGVASWWYSKHTRLGGRPADLVSDASAVSESVDSPDDGMHGKAAALIAAAQAVTSPVG